MTKEIDPEEMIRAVMSIKPINASEIDFDIPGTLGKAKIKLLKENGYVYEPSWVMDHPRTFIAKLYKQRSLEYHPNRFIKIKDGQIVRDITWKEVNEFTLEQLEDLFFGVQP